MQASAAGNRALRLLVSYLTGALGVTWKQIGPPFLTHGPDERINYTKVSAFLRENLDLSDDEYTKLVSASTVILLQQSNIRRVAADYGLLKPILSHLGIDEQIASAIGERNELSSDANFTGIFRSGVKDDLVKDQNNLHKRMGGLWYVVRLSTDTQRMGETRYDVSLLHIKPTQYLSARDARHVKTHLLHFTYRSQLGGNNQTHQVYRGRLFESNRVIYFMGERQTEGPPSIFSMAWTAKPQDLPRRGDVISVAQGMTMTANAYDIPIVTAVIGKHIIMEPIPESMSEIEQAEELERIVEIHAEKIGTYNEQKIPIECGAQQLLDTLKSNWRAGTEDGFFRVFP